MTRSDYVNVVRADEEESARKPIYKRTALVVVDEDHVDEFDKVMESRNARWAGRLFTNNNGYQAGWVSYTARGANMDDIKKVIGHLVVNLEPIDRVIVLLEDEE